ncbi:uncharacterized protein EV422DRAFT_508394 [Fimicolochytrium jonesii]|uniref:uncharacterized protein n=1 Tax=Fimicolochytrium jonesii TaxID=1396493 RepID=UPI0022FEA992|nr:uncharacterized protein EV422DRAFT_508394 [Fimicolochytrium jonesii]KAI8818181.1 hypothetical protein EV422DRAFT_508394 [Fimicolochytrium jonesii]
MYKTAKGLDKFEGGQTPDLKLNFPAVGWIGKDGRFVTLGAVGVVGLTHNLPRKKRDSEGLYGNFSGRREQREKTRVAPISLFTLLGPKLKDPSLLSNFEYRGDSSSVQKQWPMNDRSWDALPQHQRPQNQTVNRRLPSIHGDEERICQIDARFTFGKNSGFLARTGHRVWASRSGAACGAARAGVVKGDEAFATYDEEILAELTAMATSTASHHIQTLQTTRHCRAPSFEDKKDTAVTNRNFHNLRCTKQKRQGRVTLQPRARETVKLKQCHNGRRRQWKLISMVVKLSITQGVGRRFSLAYLAVTANVIASCACQELAVLLIMQQLRRVARDLDFVTSESLIDSARVTNSARCLQSCAQGWCIQIKYLTPDQVVVIREASKGPERRCDISEDDSIISHPESERWTRKIEADGHH